MPLSKRHEHDHFPIPARHGGAATCCVCINCHDLVDRGQDEIGPSAFIEAWHSMTPPARIAVARLMRAYWDQKKRIAS
jgi:hypothetical protein